MRPETGFARLAWLFAVLAIVAAIYWPGLSGGWLFDDYPNIVDNHGVQPANASIPSLVGAALSSPASDFKRPLASLSFAANYLATGLDPYWMKLTNLVVHLLNGWLVFWLARRLLRQACRPEAVGVAGSCSIEPSRERDSLVALLVAACWLLLPINLTGVLYVVQRMESLANLFVLLGLMGYVAGRQRMLVKARGGLALCVISLVLATGVGVLAKETAVMLPLYALLVEWVLFHFRTPSQKRGERPVDWRVVSVFVLVLLLPMLVGLTWLLPHVLPPASWATRDFDLSTRLLSEARIVVAYIGWTLLPLPHELGFYHDDVVVSTGLLHPWTTLASLLVLAALAVMVIALRRRRPLVSLGLALFLGCHLLTGTILPLELVYEHRNYFASLGLLLALVPLLATPRPAGRRWPLPTHVLLGGLMAWWLALTAYTAYAWGDPLRLAQELARRAPGSPRAQYELGRTYIIYSHYEPASPYTRAAYAPLERAAALPESSILPQQALIFMNSRMHLPLKESWWASMTAKLRAKRPGVQDESSLAALVECAREGSCALPRGRMLEAFEAAMAHPDPSARLLATYGDYAWNVLGDQAKGEQLTTRAVQAAPGEPAYRITLARMLLGLGRTADARVQVQALRGMNIGGRLDGPIDNLALQIDATTTH